MFARLWLELSGNVSDTAVLATFLGLYARPSDVDALARQAGRSFRVRPFSNDPALFSQDVDDPLITAREWRDGTVERFESKDKGGWSPMAGGVSKAGGWVWSWEYLAWTSPVFVIWPAHADKGTQMRLDPALGVLYAWEHDPLCVDFNPPVLRSSDWGWLTGRLTRGQIFSLAKASPGGRSIPGMQRGESESLLLGMELDSEVMAQGGGAGGTQSV